MDQLTFRCGCVYVECPTTDDELLAVSKHARCYSMNTGKDMFVIVGNLVSIALRLDQGLD